MKIPLWIRCLPHNLATIRPNIRFIYNPYWWAVGVTLYFDSAPGDKNYLLHFDSTGLLLDLGPFTLELGLTDTPGTDCEENLRAKGKL